ncbi:hypothetical protein MTR67_032008 [Solanum verrucosum]|uniref:Uncharacterized protein n=1 Tax=Solanum verrucosum TaxID=315347 RepID=A0AAF0U3L2_SOLVR|nr:hypothetical protein MTR67_032008 [Solanum verrucosum]
MVWGKILCWQGITRGTMPWTEELNWDVQYAKRKTECRNIQNDVGMQHLQNLAGEEPKELFRG